MDFREKLVELQSIITCPNAICNFCEHFKNKDACEKHKKEVIADNMIAHGVTVQEWISVKDQLPESGKDAVLIALRWGTVDIGWCEEGRWGSEFVNEYDDGEVTHWMPLPQPPKGG